MKSGLFEIVSLRMSQNSRHEPTILEPGEFEVVFHVGDYFRDRLAGDVERPALDIVPIRFSILRPATYVLPVRIEPWGFTLDRRR